MDARMTLDILQQMEISFHFWVLSRDPSVVQPVAQPTYQNLLSWIVIWFAL
jgi:hypothetical protein